MASISSTTLLRQSSGGLDRTNLLDVRNQHAEDNDRRGKLSHQDVIDIEVTGTDVEPPSFLNPQQIEPEHVPLTSSERLFQVVRGFLTGIPFLVFMSLCTVYALFGNDLRLAFMPIDADPAFQVVTAVIIGIFVLELVFTSIFTPEYRWSFFFFLDIVAAVSLVFDLDIVFDLMSGDDVQSMSMSTARAGRAAKAGSRAGRIFKLVRVVRFVRMIRFIKLFKYARTTQHKKKEKQLSDRCDDNPTVVGLRVSDEISKKVIIGVLAMLIVLPLLQLDARPEYALNVELLHLTDAYHPLLAHAELCEATPEEEVGICSAKVDALSEAFSKMLSVSQGKYAYNYLKLGEEIMIPRTNRLRREEQLRVKICRTDSDCTNPAAVAEFDVSSDTESAAAFSLGTTLFVTVLLTVGSLLISRDTHRLLILPIKRMVDLVQCLALNPLYKLHARTYDAKAHRELHEGLEMGLETSHLQLAIAKLGGMLQIGFGEAGAHVIAANLQQSAAHDSKMTTLDLMNDGQEYKCIFCEVEILRFDEVCEISRVSVMKFINKIASIVYRTADQSGGFPNKAVLNKLMLVWAGARVAGDLRFERRREEACKSGDYALAAAVKAVSSVHHSRELAEIVAQSGLSEKLGGFEPKLGFGLHYGWAVEGAVGSDLKVDASYLSPHVRITGILQQVTQRYGVDVMMSQSFYDILSPFVREKCRFVDCLLFPGMTVPMRLYTYDMLPPPKSAKREDSLVKVIDFMGDEFESGSDTESDDENGPSRSSATPSIESRKKMNPFELRKSMKGLLDLPLSTTTSFRRGFTRGVQLYVEGEWESARVQLIRCQDLCGMSKAKPNTNQAPLLKAMSLGNVYSRSPSVEDREVNRGATAPPKNTDGPTEFLLAYMASFNYQAPRGWSGFRPCEPADFVPFQHYQPAGRPPITFSPSKSPAKPTHTDKVRVRRRSENMHLTKASVQQRSGSLRKLSESKERSRRRSERRQSISEGRVEAVARESDNPYLTVPVMHHVEPRSFSTPSSTGSSPGGPGLAGSVRVHLPADQ